MSSYSYVAIDARGAETRGTLEVADQNEALRRVREMGLFPTRLFSARESKHGLVPARVTRTGRKGWGPFGGRVGAGSLTLFTRQLATLMQAGMPLLRGLRILQEQEPQRTLRRILGELALAIENGSSFSEALAQHPKIFNRLYVYMVRAGEVAGALELTLRRLAEFMEKARRIKAKVKGAMYYPCAVLTVAGALLVLLMTFIVPRFRAMFEGLTSGAPLPAFSAFVFRLSEALTRHAWFAVAIAAGIAVLFMAGLKTNWGLGIFDRFKLSMPLLGPLFTKTAIARFTRTLGTLMGSGVPVLQALTIVQETAGNVRLGKIIAQVHDKVQEGDPIAPTLKSSGFFPVMAASMVDVGEQTGALPEMLLKIADDYDEEVDNAASALTSLLEPIMIVFLAIIVGSIVIAIFLPLLHIDPAPAPERGE